MKVIHIITGLNVGGAENMLYKLIKASKYEVENKVITLTGRGKVADWLDDIGVGIYEINMSKSPIFFKEFIKLCNWLKKEKSDIIQTWMYHSDFLGGIAAKIFTNTPVVWNIRHSNLIAGKDKRTTIWTAKLSAKFSECIPEKIITNSYKAKEYHSNLGYNKDKIQVIPNGFDLARFFRTNNKIDLGLKRRANSFLIGMLARFNPQKDYKSLIEAISYFKSNYYEIYKDTNFILCGRNVNYENKKLQGWIKDMQVQDQVKCLGPREEVEKIMSSLDVFTLSSASGEGFPNVIGEAMASYTPCVVTDVGDSARIVGDTGIVVPPESPHKLAEGWAKLLNYNREKRIELGEVARKKIEENYSIETIKDKYLNLYEEILANK